MANLYLGLGSNLGDRKKNITNATMIIGSVLGEIRTLSSLYETDPWGFSSENKFLNAAILIETQQEPLLCLQILKAVEREMGRSYTKSNGYEDRIIDIDILFYDNQIIETEELTVPHPLLPKRDFVLKPMAEIAPDFIHPVSGLSMKELLSKIS